MELLLERTFDISCIRNIRSITLDEFGRPGETACWSEWRHPLEQSRSFEHIFRGYHDAYGWSRLIRPGDTCIDIGAHSGDTTVPLGVFASFGDVRGVVVAVEPNPDVFNVLEINLATNSRQSKFVALRVAITREDVDEVEISDYGSALCNGGIIDPSYSVELLDNLNNRPNSSFTVRGVSLETLCSQSLSPHELARLRFVKIDCEGYDKEILRSSARILQEYKPFIFVEWFAYFSLEDSLDLFDAIDAIGYAPLDPFSWTPITATDKNPGDLLLVPKTRLPEMQRYR